MSPSHPPSQSTITQLTTLIHTWADSMDTKSWSLFASLLAPTISIDYPATMGGLKTPTVPSGLFVKVISAANYLGSPELRTQHLVGGALCWSLVDDELVNNKNNKQEVTRRGKERWRCRFQIRAAHSRLLPPSFSPSSSSSSPSAAGDTGQKVPGREIKADAHGVNTLEFERIVNDDEGSGGGEWRIVSIKVDLRWVEGDLDAVFGRNSESESESESRSKSKSKNQNKTGTHKL